MLPRTGPFSASSARATTSWYQAGNSACGVSTVLGTVPTSARDVPGARRGWERSDSGNANRAAKRIIGRKRYGRPMLARAWGIARSLVMYHGIPGRHRQMVRFYSQFLGPGDLALDVAAHVGSRVRAWRRIGARVVAVEPQPDCVRVLRLFFGRDPGVAILPGAVGAEAGRARIGVSTRTPTVSSM